MYLQFKYATLLKLKLIQWGTCTKKNTKRDCEWPSKKRTHRNIKTYFIFRQRIWRTTRDTPEYVGNLLKSESWGKTLCCSTFLYTSQLPRYSFTNSFVIFCFLEIYFIYKRVAALRDRNIYSSACYVEYSKVKLIFFTPGGFERVMFPKED